MKGHSGKGAVRSVKNSLKISPIFIFVTICGFAFYLGKLFCSENKISLNDSKIDKDVFIAPLRITPVEFPECGMEYQDYTPCTDPKVYRLILILCWFILDTIQFAEVEKVWKV